MQIRTVCRYAFHVPRYRHQESIHLPYFPDSQANAGDSDFLSPVKPAFFGETTTSSYCRLGGYTNSKGLLPTKVCRIGGPLAKRRVVSYIWSYVFFINAPRQNSNMLFARSLLSSCSHARVCFIVRKWAILNPPSYDDLFRDLPGARRVWRAGPSRVKAGAAYGPGCWKITAAMTILYGRPH